MLLLQCYPCQAVQPPPPVSVLPTDADAAAHPRGVQHGAAAEPPEAAGDTQAEHSQEVTAASPRGDKALLQHPPAVTTPIPQGALWHRPPGLSSSPCPASGCSLSLLPVVLCVPSVLVSLALGDFCQESIVSNVTQL